MVDHRATTSLDKRAIAKCKNLGKIEIIGASDVIEYDVETNIEGDVLYPDAINTYTPNVFGYFLVPGTERETQKNFVESGFYSVAFNV